MFQRHLFTDTFGVGVRRSGLRVRLDSWSGMGLKTKTVYVDIFVKLAQNMDPPLKATFLPVGTIIRKTQTILPILLEVYLWRIQVRPQEKNNS